MLSGVENTSFWVVRSKALPADEQDASPTSAGIKLESTTSTNISAEPATKRSKKSSIDLRHSKGNVFCALNALFIALLDDVGKGAYTFGIPALSFLPTHCPDLGYSVHSTRKLKFKAKSNFFLL